MIKLFSFILCLIEFSTPLDSSNFSLRLLPGTCRHCFNICQVGNARYRFSIVELLEQLFCFYEIPELHVLYFLLNPHQFFLILSLNFLIFFPQVFGIIRYDDTLLLQANAVHFFQLFLPCYNLTCIACYCAIVGGIEALYESMRKTLLTQNITLDGSNRVCTVHRIHVLIRGHLLVICSIHTHELWLRHAVICVICLFLLIYRCHILLLIRLLLKTIFHYIHQLAVGRSHI